MIFGLRFSLDRENALCSFQRPLSKFMHFHCPPSPWFSASISRTWPMPIHKKQPKTLYHFPNLPPPFPSSKSPCQTPFQQLETPCPPDLEIPVSQHYEKDGNILNPEKKKRTSSSKRGRQISYFCDCFGNSFWGILSERDMIEGRLGGMGSSREVVVSRLGGRIFLWIALLGRLAVPLGKGGRVGGACI